LGLRWLTRRIPDRFKSRIPTFTGEFEAIDWERTRVYFSSVASQSLMLNRRGREPWGIVSPGGEYERIREEVIAGLKSLQHPETSQAVVSHVYRPEEIYHGPFVSRAPDIIVQCAPGFQLQHGFDAPVIQSAQRSPGSRSGIHAPEGMALGWGAGVKSSASFHAHIADVAPTVLHAFGLSVPDLDGRVLEELFDSPALVTAGSSKPYSPEQEKKITERLERLGYL
jgi:predicted AlkP superfamily phosphohydrolase/phosphomutase